MKYSILDLTQTILSRMDSDQVNSISDTTEATQVANVIRTTYFNILSRADLPELNKLFSLDAPTDITIPTVMSRPDNVTRVDWIKYDLVGNDIPNDYRYVTILPLEQFLDMTKFNTNEDNVFDLTLDSKLFFYRNDRQPCYCTIYKNYYVIFDAYDATIDSTLQSTKTECFGQMIPVFELTDDFIPEMDDRMFPLLLNEATSVAFLEMKQIVNEAASQETRRQWQNLQRIKDLKRPNYFDQLPDFGRKC